VHRPLLALGRLPGADARLLDGDPLEVDQSALTGESLPVTRDPGEAVYSGAVIKRGEIDALVYATGASTYFGRTAQLVQEARTVSHFQQAVLKVGDYLIFLAGGLVLLILTVALFRGDPFLQTLQFALILTVASVPVAMPTVLSVTMAVGARLLAAKEAVVSRLAAIEELAGMDVLCSDKTGTLTEGRPELVESPLADIKTWGVAAALEVARDPRREQRDDEHEDAESDDGTDQHCESGATRMYGFYSPPGRSERRRSSYCSRAGTEPTIACTRLSLSKVRRRSRPSLRRSHESIT